MAATLYFGVLTLAIGDRLFWGDDQLELAAAGGGHDGGGPPADGRPPPGFALRDARAADFDAIGAIYAHHVRTGLATFDLDAPPAADLRRRWEALVADGLPYLVGVFDGVVVGFGYCAPYRPRAAYRFTVEDSVYLAPEAYRRGIGRALLAELVRRCEAAGYRQMLAVVGDSANAASIGLHRALGFELRGTLRAVGFKHGRWVDTVILQRALGAREPP